MKRGERESSPTAAEKESFIDLCIEVGNSDRRSMLKNILRTKYASAVASAGDKPADELPGTLQELLRTDPSSSQFVDYTYMVCSMENQISKKELAKLTLMDAFDGMLTSTPPRKSKRQKARKLPAKLSPFVLDEGSDNEQTLGSIGAIVDDFFPEMGFVFPCVYADAGHTSFVLFIPDRNVNRWKAAGSQCKFVWRTSEQDVNTEIFSKVINAVPRVHVVRERSSEVVYMGTCKSIDNVNSLGKCTMFVS